MGQSSSPLKKVKHLLCREFATDKACSNPNLLIDDISKLLNRAEDLCVPPHIDVPDKGGDIDGHLPEEQVLPEHPAPLPEHGSTLLNNCSTSYTTLLTNHHKVLVKKILPNAARILHKS